MGRREWDKLLGNCEVVLDIPGAAFLPTLIAAYPNAKVIIAQRDPSRWLQSYMDTIGVAQSHRQVRWILSLLENAYLKLFPAALRALLFGLFQGVPAFKCQRRDSRADKGPVRCVA